MNINQESELVTLTLTRKQAQDLSYILQCVYQDGIEASYISYPPKAPRHKGDKQIRAAAQSIKKLADRRRKTAALDFRNDW